MDLYSLVSIVAALKQKFQMQTPTDSFCIASKRAQPYIEPTFAKVVFPTERPTVILISAVGATGKSTLAQVLSHQTGLPLLDLGKHKPVGDNTLTGLLTSAFPVKDLSAIFEGLNEGRFGVVIDGLDEGRTKTTEKAFDAFLDDIVKLCTGNANTTFVLLGRTQTIEECWIYLADKKISTGLVSIEPFGVEAARKYIDEFSRGLTSPHSAQYAEVRDDILAKLTLAFSAGSTAAEDTFVSFIGYPPVLDSIVTLLEEQGNYHKMKAHFSSRDSSEVEIGLLYRIAAFIMEREKELKVKPSVLIPLVADLPQDIKEAMLNAAFEPLEQCIRVVAYSLERHVSLQRISDPLINERYEKQLQSWLPEHPFINGRNFRNVVFEAVAVASLVASEDPEAVELGLAYLDSHKYNYHFVFFLHQLCGHRKVPIACLHALLGSALEFISTDADVATRVESNEALSQSTGTEVTKNVETEIEILMGPDGEKSRTFMFHSEILEGVPVRLCRRLSSSFILLPCEVVISGSQEIEFAAPVVISAKKIALHAPAMVVRASTKQAEEKFVLLEASQVESTIGALQINGADFGLTVADRASLTYPLVQYALSVKAFPDDSLLKEKYLRLRRILVQFRSHSRGTMARFRPKIENERVAGNEVGQAILQRLLSDGILTVESRFYFLEPKNVDKHLGISWLDLQKGQTSERLVQYLRSVA
jgi:hypothetical protein